MILPCMVDERLTAGREDLKSASSDEDIWNEYLNIRDPWPEFPNQ